MVRRDRVSDDQRRDTGGHERQIGRQRRDRSRGRGAARTPAREGQRTEHEQHDAVDHQCRSQNRAAPTTTGNSAPVVRSAVFTLTATAYCPLSVKR